MLRLELAASRSLTRLGSTDRATLRGMNTSIVQAIGGYVIAGATMALVAFNKKLMLNFEPETQIALITLALAGVGLGAHGTSVSAAKTLDQQPPAP